MSFAPGLAACAAAIAHIGIEKFAPGDGEAVGSGDIGDDYELELTRENVELVLDEMRPFLKADGYDGLLLIQ